MTVKEWYPLLKDDHRKRIGNNIAQCYRSINKKAPDKKSEDEFNVNDYEVIFKSKAEKVYLRYLKKYPDALVIVDKPKRKRVSAAKVKIDGE